MIVSTSKIKCYKSCKRLYYFKYVQNLESVETTEALKDGTDYHSNLESLYNDGWFKVNLETPKVTAMSMAYEKYISPKFKVKKAEESFEFKLNDDHTLVGRFDGIAEDGCIVEHKTTSSDVDEEYIYNLRWDEQTLNYMLASGKNKIYYTICKKPTIRQKQNETAEEFLDRCIEWYSVDTDKKIRTIVVERSKEEIKAQLAKLIFIADEMEKLEKTFGNREYDVIKLAFYENQCNCTSYGSRCKFASICLDYDPKLEYIEFKSRKEH